MPAGGSYESCLLAAPARSSYALCRRPLPGALKQTIWKSDKMQFIPKFCIFNPKNTFVLSALYLYLSAIHRL
jgi:hypothetical protein